MRRRGVLSNNSILVEAAVTGKWKDVVKMCKSNPDLISHRVTITRETTLHMAISDRQTEIVEKLVELMKNSNGGQARTALTAANERGNTPLHLAAAIGDRKMCSYIIGVDVDGGLIACRNRDGETPLFLAVLHGNKSAFNQNLHGNIQTYYELTRKQRQRPDGPVDYSLCSRKDGNTILHSAIAGDYFEMANIIVDAFPNLVDKVGADGFSPLEMLATKPSAFRSGISITGLSRFLYYIFPGGYIPGDQHSVKEDSSDDGKEDSHVEDPNNTKHLLHRGLDRGIHLLGRIIKDCLLLLLGIIVNILLLPFYFAFFLPIIIVGPREALKIRNTKAVHTWSVRLLDKLLPRKINPDDGSTRPPELQLFDEDLTPPNNAVHFYLPQHDENEGYKGNGEIEESSVDRRPNPLLIAAKNGIVEIVEKYLKRFPGAVFETDEANKNIVLLAVEHRQPQVYQFVLLKLKTAEDILFRQVDSEGNSVLHLAAKLGDEYRTRLNQDAALHMQREIKWFQYVKKSKPVESSIRLNSDKKTAEELFRATHKDLVKLSAAWFVHVSQSCSTVAALVATVAFATATTIPGGVKQDIGTPALEKETAFYVFAISSLVALCFSVTSTVLFLAILTSGFQIRDFHTSLPMKLLMGLATLCVSITGMMVSFCASHFFILKDKLSYGAFGLNAAMALMPVIMTFSLLSRFPHSIDLMWATFTNGPPAIPPPESSNEMILP